MAYGGDRKELPVATRNHTLLLGFLEFALSPVQLLAGELSLSLSVRRPLVAER